MRRPIYDALASLFEYPGPDFAEKTAGVLEDACEHGPEAMPHLEAFAALLPYGRVDDATLAMEELFTRTFDVQATTTLDVGYVVFGDDYKRGELLVNLNREHREAGVACGDELADHLTNLLRLLAVRDRDATLDDLVAMILAPALRQMIGEFEAGRRQAKEKQYQKHHRTLIEVSTDRQTIYSHALLAVYAVLEGEFDLAESGQEPVKTTDFLESLTRELEIEADEQGPQEQRMPGTC